ncbi:MAG: glycosyltransferase domain-containing protein [Bacteroidales bacterium]
MSRVIAFGTNKQAFYDLFIESCRRYNIEPVILGWGEKWVGFGRKSMMIREYIRGLPEDEIVISVDPFDVIFLCGLDEIENKFNNMSASFLCGALKLGKFNGAIYNYEFNKTDKRLPETPTKYNFLNTGTWISRAGYAGYLIDELVDKYQMSETSMDQQILTGIYIRNSHRVDIDWNCEIFHNLLFKDFVTRKPDLKDLHFNTTRVINTASGSKPCILHASGNTNMEILALKLGYDPNIIVPANNMLNFAKKTIFHVNQILKPSRLFNTGNNTELHNGGGGTTTSVP